MVIKKKIGVFAIILLIFAFALSSAVLSLCNSLNIHSVATADDASTNAVAYLGSENFVKALKGEQNEYVYFGTNTFNGGGVVRWRVLSKNDTKYGNGDSLLLWADNALGSLQYGTYSNNPYYAYYGMSYMRALLNNGYNGKTYQYQTAVGNTSAQPSLANFSSTSYYQTLFNTTERDMVAGAKDIVSHSYLFHVNSAPIRMITSVTNMIDYFPDTTNNVSSDSFSVDKANTTISETAKGDALFLLDYDDINNIAYGMYDLEGGNKVTYASKFTTVAPNWSSWQDHYPGWHDENSSQDKYAVKYLSGYGRIWLRPAGRYIYSGSSWRYYSGALILWDGCVAQAPVAESFSVHPAFNLNPENIVYATANTSSSVGSTFASLSTAGKPAYKLYIKDNSFTDSKKASFVKKDNKLTVTFPSANSSAKKAVALLSKKDSTDGSVLYQADASIVANKAEFTLPSNLNLKDYVMTVLLTTNNGGFASETVYDQYAFDAISITYCNLINGADSKDFLGGQVQTVSFGEDLHTPTSAEIKPNHKFVGWTTDKTGKTDPITEFPENYESDMKFYAVWDVDSMTSEVLEVFDDKNAEKDTMEYLLGKLTVKPKITASNMDDLVFASCEWSRDGTKLSAKTETLTIENVDESGAFVLTYTIHSKSEPLWRHSGKTSAKTATITPGQLTPKSLSVEPTAYYGMELGALTPSAVMHNSKGEVVSGTTHWVRSLGKLTENKDDINYIEGKAYVEFYFIPDDSKSAHKGNYVSGKFTEAHGSTPASGANYNKADDDIIVYFDVEQIKVVFNMTQLDDKISFAVDTYNDDISYSRIANEFNALWKEYYEENSGYLDGIGITGYTPQFKRNSDGKFYNISDYRKLSGGYSDVTETVTIDVNFVQAEYSVTYKFDDEKGTDDRVEKGKTYGQQLLKPSPNPTNGALMFLGWYYPATDVNGDPILEPSGEQKLSRWDFDVDRIFGDLILTARWLKAERLDRIEVEANKPSYTALNSIVAGDLKVTAVFIAKDEDGKEVEMPVVLEFADYKDGIEYIGNINGDNTLHVNSDGSPFEIKVSYSYFNDGTTYTESDTVELAVTPRKIDISDLNIKEKYIIYDGEAHSIDPIDLATVQHLADSNSRKINGIVYTYYSGRTVVQPEDIIDIGDYTVVISFTTNDPDFEVDPVNTMLYIVSELPPGIEPENPNPGNNEGEGGDGKGGNAVADFFKNLIESHFPLWQVIVMAVSAILTLIFLIKSIQYGNRAKKAKNEAKKISARAYVSILPVFSTEIVALGLENKMWSIMAFSCAGVAVLMFVVALITRHSWKKAELAKENALDDRENRKFNADMEEREAEKRERREFKEMLALSNANGGGSDNSALIEQMRMEMEAREARYREELARRDEEQARRDEEQAKRDEAMRMMLANFMGRGAGADGDDGMIYGSVDDTDMLVQRVIAGLLPAVQQMIPEPTAYLTAPSEQNEELLHVVEEQNAQIQAMSAQMNELQAQLSSVHEIADAVIIPDNSDEIKSMTDEISALRKEVAALSVGNTTTVYVERDSDDDDDDEEEEWDSILDDDDDDFIEATIIEEDGSVKKVSPNFRMRLKESSDKNREWYAGVKNLFCSQKGVTYRVYKRVEKIRYQGQVIAVIGIAKRSIKLWLALKPYEYDARRYHHKDVSDKPRFVDVPLYVRVGSDRALTRAQELILALFQEQNMEARKRYNDRDIQELIFTLKHNKLLTNKQYKRALCQVVHVHDCNVLDDETAEKCIETKNVDFIDDSVIETVKLDDIDAMFQDGNRVTLEKLRKAGLVSEECTGYTVVADKRLTKPLIIVANDFTLPAVKMIALTGGRVIKLNQV